MAQRKYNICVCSLAGKGWVHRTQSRYMFRLGRKIGANPLVGDVDVMSLSITPTTCARNRAAVIAMNNGADLLFFIDDDVEMDHPKVAEKSFFDTSLEFINDRYDHAPTVIAAPYCGPPPNENVFVFRWRNKTALVDAIPELDAYTREEAAVMGGITEVAALPTGAMLIDLRIFKGMRSKALGVDVALPRPWFRYEYKDETESDLASTEDVTFSRDVDIIFRHAGFGPTQFCNWDSWAIHHKMMMVGRPQIVGGDTIGKILRKAWEQDISTIDRVVELPARRIKLPSAAEQMAARGEIVETSKAWDNAEQPYQEVVPLNGESHA